MLIYLSAAVLVFFIVAFIGALDVSTPIYEVYRNAFHFIVLVFLPFVLNRFFLLLLSPIFKGKTYFFSNPISLCLCYGIGYFYPIYWYDGIANFWTATLIQGYIFLMNMRLYDFSLIKRMKLFLRKHSVKTESERLLVGIVALLCMIGVFAEFLNRSEPYFYTPIGILVGCLIGYGIWYSAWFMKKTLKDSGLYPSPKSWRFLIYLLFLFVFLLLVAIIEIRLLYRFWE